MSSKGNGEGSVYYNKQRKKWNAQYKEYDTETGKMKYKTNKEVTKSTSKELVHCAKIINNLDNRMMLLNT